MIKHLFSMVMSLFSASTAFAGEYKILFTGDLHFAHTYTHKPGFASPTSLNPDNDYNGYLDHLRVFLDRANYVVTNLESPVTDEEVSVFADSKTYVHREPSAALAQFFVDNHFNAVSLANNHFIDFGRKGIEDSLKFMKENGIKSFGAGLNRYSARRPHIFSLRLGKNRVKIALIGAFEYRKKYDEVYEAYAGGENTSDGVNRLSAKATESQVLRLKEAHPGIKVILYPHWGENYTWVNEKQEALANRAIESGVDLIIGHGAHMVQDIKAIGNKISVFSLGNFIFNSPGRYNGPDKVPFSQLVYLTYKSKKGVLTASLKIYPIVSNNQLTGFKPRPLTQTEFEERYIPAMLAHSCSTFESIATRGHDDLGYHLTIKLDSDLNVLPASNPF